MSADRTDHVCQALFDQNMKAFEENVGTICMINMKLHRGEWLDDSERKIVQQCLSALAYLLTHKEAFVPPPGATQ